MKEVVLPPVLNPLQFTVIGAKPLPLILTLAETDIEVTTEIMDILNTQISPVSLVLRLTLDHTQSATVPHLVSKADPYRLIAIPPERVDVLFTVSFPQVTEDVFGVMEVVIGGSVASIKFTSLCGDDFLVVQQLHLPPTTAASRQSSLPLPCTSCGKACIPASLQGEEILHFQM